MTPRLAPTSWASIELDLPVNPVPLARPRFVTDARGRRFAHTHETTADFYVALQWALRLAGVREPVRGDLRLELRLWRRTRGARGDLSNLVKAFEDASNGVLWEDDRQVVALDAELVDWGAKVEGRILARVTPHPRSQG